MTRTDKRTIGVANSVTTGAALLATYSEKSYIHCDISGVYRIWVNSSYADRTLGATQTYPFRSTKITTILNGVVADGAVEAME